MKWDLGTKCIVLTLLFLSMSKMVFAQQEVLIADVLASPQKFVNASVSIKGTVMNVNAEPAGTNKGFYEITDDSDGQIIVKTKQLPQVGKDIKVTGVVVQNPDTQETYLKELNRSSGASLNLYIIAGGGALLVIIIVAVFLLVRPSKKAVSALPPTVSQSSPSVMPPTVMPPTVKPGSSPTIAPITKVSDRTMTVSASNAGGRVGDKTQMALSVNAELSVTTGRDSGKRFPIMKPSILIGRGGSRANDVENH